jgi:hypothetical protein
VRRCGSRKIIAYPCRARKYVGGGVWISGSEEFQGFLFWRRVELRILGELLEEGEVVEDSVKNGELPVQVGCKTML